MITEETEFTINEGTIRGNSAVNSGGGIFIDTSGGTITFFGGTITGNTAGVRGGGVYLRRGTIGVDTTIITGNEAPDDPDRWINP
jgi:hypothetical protein